MNELKQLLKNKIIKELKENYKDVSICIFPKDYQSDYLEHLLHSYIKICADFKEPIYNSRQEFLTSLFIGKNNELLFHVKECGGSKTLMGGSKKDDPFYDPNTEIGYYMVENKKYINRSVCNLKSQFESFYSKTEYDVIGKLDISEVTIKEFDEVFTPKDKEKIIDFKNRIKAFLDKYIVPQLKQFQKVELRGREQKKDEKILFLDECGQKIDQRSSTSGFIDQLQVGRILSFYNLCPKIITEIKVEPCEKRGFTTIVLTKDFKENIPELKLFMN